MNFCAVFLRKLEPSCEIEAYSAAIFRKVLYRKWLPLALSLSQYRALFTVITSTKRCGTPVLEKRLCASQRKRTPITGKLQSHHKTTSPSVTLLPNFREVQIPLSSTVPEVYIAITQYPGVPPLSKLEVLPNFRVAQ